MTAPIGTRCTTACRRPTQSQAHCSVCHRTFGGLSGFDKHRRHGVCLDPATQRMREVDGIWRWPVREDAPGRPWPKAVEARTGEVGGIG